MRLVVNLEAPRGLASLMEWLKNESIYNSEYHQLPYKPRHVSDVLLPEAVYIRVAVLGWIVGRKLRTFIIVTYRNDTLVGENHLQKTL